MKIKIRQLFILVLACLYWTGSFSQNYKQNPEILIDFGSSNKSTPINAGKLRQYRKANSSCPDDGYYSFTNYTQNCFEGRWHTLLQDHTADDLNGKMMLVNASERPGPFFLYGLKTLQGNTKYVFSLWLVNICLRATGCAPTPPNIVIRFEREDGSLIQNMQTGVIIPTASPKWRVFRSNFTLPSGVTRVRLRMDNVSKGGCGNDFALDDILICPIEVIEKKTLTAPVKKETPSIKEIPIPEVKKKPVIKTNPPIRNREKPVVQPPASNPTSRENDPDLGIEKVPEAAPDPATEALRLRANPLVRRIETPAAEIIVELYDNGEIDGDTISVFHNNSLVIERALLSAKPLRFTIKVNPKEPHHEIVMVAHNLGSIPPNTSLMIITANKKRYTVSISSNKRRTQKL